MKHWTLSGFGLPLRPNLGTSCNNCTVIVGFRGSFFAPRTCCVDALIHFRHDEQAGNLRVCGVWRVHAMLQKCCFSNLRKYASARILGIMCPLQPRVNLWTEVEEPEVCTRSVSKIKACARNCKYPIEQARIEENIVKPCYQLVSWLIIDI